MIDYLFSLANIDCDFETGLCGWTNDHHDNFDWRRYRGRTPTAGTGPSTDHTKGAHGGCVSSVKTFGVDLVLSSG